MFAPLTIVNVLFNTTPFFAALLAWKINGEQISKIQIVALVVSFVGICLISLSMKQNSAQEEAEGVYHPVYPQRLRGRQHGGARGGQPPVEVAL